KLKYRCRELRRQLEELEGYNDDLAVKLQRSQKRLRRMKIERNILLERFEHSRKYAKHDDDDDESASDSDAPLKDTFPCTLASDVDVSDAAGPQSSALARARRRMPVGAAASHTHHNHNSSNASTPRQTPVAATAAAANGDPPASAARKLRAERDPNAPKRPANAFVLYCQVERPNIKSAGTELTSSELTKAMGVTWKGLSKDEKQKYYDLYEREMTRYHQEMTSYTRGAPTTATAATAAVGPAQLPDAAPASSPAPVPMDVDSNPEDDDDADDDTTQPPTAAGEPPISSKTLADIAPPKASPDHTADVGPPVTPSTATEREEPNGLPAPAAHGMAMEQS
ncbi:non-histone protein, partial [Coemansia spiralis]